ncbi:GNAT family N-acetyltransferase [Herbiconiux moechotypicola]|uniref:N-acetyltransferase domain-containing protein n=1 Tax=Herbiconiux moechotypicola TaxID=637393 RepID=A0ABN3DN23_9MICO|nr:GNAT family N-acetyltransferase [Herbiconiux moechotypicola]MCS5730339.1 GNAT family N-acetyltransferase [Herbiconiux moechotypicola]
MDAQPPPPVRRAAAADSALIARLLDAFNREFGVPTPGVTVLEHRLEGLLRPEAVRCYLAHDPGRPSDTVGFALVTLRPTVWYDGPVVSLDELYVAPAHRDRGLGGALLARVVAEAAASGAGAVQIDVDEGDTAAQRFYRRHGFSETDPDTGERGIAFWRELEA